MTEARYKQLFKFKPPKQNTVVVADYLAHPEDWRVHTYSTHIVLGTRSPNHAEIHPALAHLDSAIFIFHLDELASIVGLQLMGLL